VGQVVYGHQNWNTGVNGASPSFFNIRDWPIAFGRWYTDQEEKGAAKVAVIGRTVVENVFGSQDPVGQVVRINRVPFTVIGVLSGKGQSPRGNNLDDTVYVPLATSQKKLFGSTFPNTVRNILVQVKDLSRMTEAERQITDLLKQRHRI
jgi:putative ABC transport system permease protein